MTKSIQIKDSDDSIVGSLLPVTKLDLEDKNSIQLLTKWRNLHNYAYPLRTIVTENSTKNWLLNLVLENKKRTMFWVLDLNGNKIGHVGLVINIDNNIELDNILRGKDKTPKGIMSNAIKALETLLETEFLFSKAYLKVLQSNTHALNFYKKLHYVRIDKIPLKSESQNGKVLLIPGSPAEDYFIVMEKDLTYSRKAPDRILTAGPMVSSFESSYVFDATLNGWNNEHSKYIKSFESQFAEYIGTKYALATSSCTGALHLALLALNIGPGDEVIVPELTWVATASVVRYVGATPVFADVDPLSWTISGESINNLINKKTKAIIPVHLYGYPANMHEIMNIATNSGLNVVEDAAPSVGALFENQFTGTFGDFGCFSFQGAKMLVTGEGGMLVTNNEELYKKALKIQDHGRQPGTFWIDQIGIKYKMSNLQAAFGLGQLKRVKTQIYKKRQINEWYREDLKGVKSIRFQEEYASTRSICWMTSIQILTESSFSRDMVINELNKNGIDSRPVFPAISQYPIWDQKQEVQPQANKIGNNSINLPSGVLLSRNSVTKVSDTIRKIFDVD